MSKPPSTSRILFVDDQETILSGFQLTIGRNYDVSTASSGADGIKLFKEGGGFRSRRFRFPDARHERS